MKIFLTGGNGFIGQHLLPRLVDHDVVHLAHDLREHQLVQQQLLSVNPDMVLHLAARTEVEQSFTEQITFSEINYVGTVNLLEAARQCSNLKRFVFASTMEVYGWQPVSDQIQRGDVPAVIPAFDETTVPRPNAPYAVAKLACENYIQYCNRSFGLPYTIFRQTNSYGRTDNDFFVTERVISQMLRNPDEIWLGAADPYRNFIFIDDLIDAWCAVIDHTQRGINQTYCVGPNNAVSIRDYAAMIAQKLNWHGVIHWNSRPSRPGEVFLLNSSNQKITNDLGWQPQVELSQGLDLTIQRWKSINGQQVD
jgi:nucleoside-diphosphate-sugar epimerase